MMWRLSLKKYEQTKQMEDKHRGTPKKYAFTPDEWGEKAEV